MRSNQNDSTIRQHFALRVISRVEPAQPFTGAFGQEDHEVFIAATGGQ